MSAKDLMIGDWVCTENDSTPRQIDWIKTGEVGLFWNKVVTPPYLVPIPLTPKILEKSGFIYDPNSEKEDDGWWEWRNLGVKTGNEFVNIAFRDDDVAVYDLEILKEFSAMNLHLDYVHELQHALRLCGIEKEIEL